MSGQSRARGLTLVEVVVVIVVIGILIALLLPATESAREPARRAACINNLKQLGLACHIYHDARKKLPAAGDYDVVAKKWGWSWLTVLLPYVEEGRLWDALKCNEPANADPLAPGGTGQTLANVTNIGAFLCPSYGGPRWTGSSATVRLPIANYKVLGATSKTSLAAGDPGSPAPPPYGTAGDHPDGTLYYNSATKLADITDGTSNTLVACETIEEGSTAWWYLGRYAAIVGLPKMMQPSDGQLKYAVPAGFTLGKYAEDSTVTDKTYLSADFKATPYDAANGITFGPSSKHPGVVNHLFADGSVRSIPTDVDPALYAFLITRRAGDPADEYFHYYSK